MSQQQQQSPSCSERDCGARGLLAADEPAAAAECNPLRAGVWAVEQRGCWQWISQQQQQQQSASRSERDCGARGLLAVDKPAAAAESIPLRAGLWSKGAAGSG